MGIDELLLLLLLISLQFLSVVTARCPLRFQPGCYEQLHGVWLEFRQQNFAANFTVDQFRSLQEPDGDGILRQSMLVRTAGGVELICRIRTGLEGCLRRESIPYHLRNGKSLVCYGELHIEMILGYLSDVILGSDIGLIDPYSLWSALEPYCNPHIHSLESLTCIADRWPEAFNRVWRNHPVAPDADTSLAATRLACQQSRVARVVRPFEAVETCGQPEYLCHLISELASRLHFHLRFPTTHGHCNLHVNCTGCRMRSELLNDLSQLDEHWSVGQSHQLHQLRRDSVESYQVWCQLRSDLAMVNQSQLYCPRALYEGYLVNVTDFIYYGHDHWTMAGLGEIVSDACQKRTIQSTCLLKLRQEFLASTREVREIQMGESGLTSHQLCHSVALLVVNFTELVGEKCGEQTARTACRSLAYDLVEEVYQWRFPRLCTVNCSMFEDVETTTNQAKGTGVGKYLIYVAFSLIFLAGM